MDERSDALFLSAITAAEVCNGISKLKRNGSTRKAAQPTDWPDVVVHPHGDLVIPFDIAAARLAGALMDGEHATGHSPGIADLTIAAAAGSRDLTAITRNLRQFAPLVVRVINLFESLPD